MFLVRARCNCQKLLIAHYLFLFSFEHSVVLAGSSVFKSSQIYKKVPDVCVRELALGMKYNSLQDEVHQMTLYTY